MGSNPVEAWNSLFQADICNCRQDVIELWISFIIHILSPLFMHESISYTFTYTFNISMGLLELTHNWPVYHFPRGILPYSLGGGVPLGSRKSYPRPNFANFVTLYQTKNTQLFLISVFVSDPVKRDPLLDQFSMIY